MNFYFSIPLLILITQLSWGVTPGNVLTKDDLGQVRIYLYLKLPFGYVEEVYHLKEAELRNMNFVYEDEKESYVSGRIKIPLLENNADAAKSCFKSHYTPYLVSKPEQPIQPVKNASQCSDALTDELRIAFTDMKKQYRIRHPKISSSDPKTDPLSTIVEESKEPESELEMMGLAPEREKIEVIIDHTRPEKKSNDSTRSTCNIM